ncbi:unnamed protein product [Periconia digitata]|uniref:Uncharacterized protein n=1 Tax=Periconia digitata TaxID=1303443 RepID=A0A9W4ULD3_9PLEO|nr:unnamed protein product [Periconia digitata]
MEEVDRQIKEKRITHQDAQSEAVFNKIRDDLWYKTFSSQEKSYESLYRFPSETIVGHIHTIGSHANGVWELEKTSKENKELPAHKKQLIEGCLIFHQYLVSRGLEPRLIIPDNYSKLFSVVANDSKDARDAVKEFQQALTAPLSNQMEIWDNASTDLRQLGQLILHDGSQENVDEIKDRLTECNDAIQCVNKEYGLKLSDHTIPLEYLVILSEERSQNQISEEVVVSAFKELMATFENVMGKAYAAKVFPNMTPEYTERTWATIENLKKDMGVEETEDMSDRGEEQEDPPATDEAPPPPATDEAPPPPATDDAPSATATADPLFEPSGNLDFLDFDLNPPDYGPAPTYENGITEHGKVVAIRMSSASARNSRFIINRGTAKTPIYKVCKGNVFWPGGAEKLEEDETYHVRFDSIARKRKVRGEVNTAVVTGCVEMPIMNPAPPGKRARRPDLYFRVVYHSDLDRNPNAKSLPLVEWLTRTELIQLVGKKKAEEEEQKYLPHHRKQVAVFQQYFLAGYHPDTRKPLTAQDRQEYPWLFNGVNYAFNINLDDIS